MACAAAVSPFRDIFRGRTAWEESQAGGTHNVLIAALGRLRLVAPGDHQEYALHLHRYRMLAEWKEEHK